MTPFQQLLEELGQMSLRALEAYGEDTNLAESVGACIVAGMLEPELAAQLINVPEMRNLLDEIEGRITQ